MIQGVIIGVVKSVVTQKVIKEVVKELFDADLIKKLFVIVAEWLAEQTDNDVDDKLVKAIKDALKV